jgi:uncharacterized protein (TIGR02271 family)
MIASTDLKRIAGQTVHGTDGEKIGKIVDVYESTDGDGGTFATVTTGAFGTHASFFPLDDAQLQGDDVVVPYSKDFIKGAPRVEHDKELAAEEEDALFTYYSRGGRTETAAPQGTASHDTVGHDTSGPTTDDAMTRSEERLSVGTEQREAGRARLRKYIVTEQQNVTVPVSHEEVRIEREPITDGNVGQALDGPALSEEEHEVVLTEEVPRVTKETVPVERVRLGTETVTEQAQVSEEVRKEQIEVDAPQR